MDNHTEHSKHTHIHNRAQMYNSVIYIIWLTLLIDGKPIKSMPLSTEYFDDYIICSYYAIDAKNQLALALKDTNYTVDWECKESIK